MTHAPNAAAKRPGASVPPRTTPRSNCQGVFTDNQTAAPTQGGAMSDARWGDPREYGDRIATTNDRASTPNGTGTIAILMMV